MLEISVGIISVILIATSQLLFKSGSTQARVSDRHMLLQPKILLGLALNAVAAGCWILALRKLEISYIYPILATNYLMVPLGASLFFDEPLGRRRLVATTIICAGVCLCLLGGRS